MIPRILSDEIEENFKIFPAVAILGPRQIGKTTIALQYAKMFDGVHIDLEDYNVLEGIRDDPKRYLRSLAHKLVVLDEVQRFPDLFMVLRILIDEYIREGRKHNQFLLLGSASQELLKQSSESLAGRVCYLELTTLLPQEVMLETFEAQKPLRALHKLWLRGGFPRSFDAPTDIASYVCRGQIIKAYVEKDIPELVDAVPRELLTRLWTSLAHLQGESFHPSKLASSLEIPAKNISRFVSFMTDLMLLRKLQPWSRGNIKKRLIKSPRIYIRDSGILHNLLHISEFRFLLNHYIRGKSWEGFVIEAIINSLPQNHFIFPYFYRSSSGEEIDLLLEISLDTYIAIDITSSSTAHTSKGFHQACETVKTNNKFVIFSGEISFPTKNNTRAMTLADFLKELPTIIQETQKSHASRNPHKLS